MSSQTKISKQYIGDDQVGSSQIQLENNSSLRSKDSSDVNVDLMKLDSSNQLQILVQPNLPGDASSALQAIPKQQLDAAVDAVQSNLEAHIDDASGAHAASAISFDNSVKKHSQIRILNLEVKFSVFTSEFI